MQFAAFLIRILPYENSIDEGVLGEEKRRRRGDLIQFLLNYEYIHCFYRRFRQETRASPSAYSPAGHESESKPVTKIEASFVVKAETENEPSSVGNHKINFSVNLSVGKNSLRQVDSSEKTEMSTAVSMSKVASDSGNHK